MRRSGSAVAWVLAVVLVSCAAPAAPAGRSAPAAGGAGGAAGAAPGAVATRPPTLSVTVAIPATSLSQFPLTLGKSAGVFEAHGIDLTINQMQTNAAIAAAIAGEVDYATPAGSLIRAIAQGAPLRVVASITDRATHTLAVNPAVVPDGSALVGKRIAINSPGDNTQLEADAAMQRFGLDKKAYTPVTIPNDGPRLAAMQAGAVDAAILSFPLNFQAEQLGFKILVNYVDFYEQPTSVLATSEQKIASQPTAIQRMVEATLAATQYTRTHKAEAAQLIAVEYDLDLATAEAAYELVRESWSATGVLTETAYQNATEPLELNPTPSMDAVVDLRFVNAARRGG